MINVMPVIARQTDLRKFGLAKRDLGSPVSVIAVFTHKSFYVYFNTVI